MVFFSGYTINRYFVKLKMPRDFYTSKSLVQNKKLQSGTCLWRGLYARWNLVSQTHTLLDFSQVKQYRMGFDTTLPKYKSTQKLMEYRNLRFNLTYSSMLRDHIFYNFFFNHGTYSSTTNHNLLLWYPVYRQVFKLNKFLQAKRKTSLCNVAAYFSSLPWMALWPQDALVWSLLASRKLEAVSSQGYLTDAMVDGYDDFFYMLAAWEHIPTAPYLYDEYLVESEADTYILPELLGHKDVPLQSTLSGVEDESPLVYTGYNLIKLLEDAFFKRAELIKYKSQSTNRSKSFFTVLMFALID